jgi:hypothetical protein
MLRYYTYRHVSLKTRKPFYVGCASKRANRNIQSIATEYERAYSKSSRTKKWKGIALEHGYLVEVISEYETRCEAIKAEEFFIKTYGLIDNGGLLVNFIKNEVNKKTGRILDHNPDRPITRYWLGKKRDEETKKKISEKSKGISNIYVKKRVRCIETGIVYESITDAAKDNNCIEQSIGKCCRGVIKKTNNLSFEFYDEDSYNSNYKRAFRKVIDSFGKEYSSIMEASIYNQCNYTSIRMSCNGGLNSVKTVFGKKTFKYI